MTELIQIHVSKGGKQVVSGRELHEYLGIGTDFTNWCKRMFEYGFIENTDFALTKIGELNNQPNAKIDYVLTLDCAKHISMIQRSEKGMKARQYFIDAEKKLSITPFALPTYADALRQLAEKVEEREAMQKQLEEQRPAVELYNTAMSSDDAMDMMSVAKLLKTGRNRLFAFLRDQKILISNADSLPYQQYIDAGYFKVIEVPFKTPDEKVHLNKKVLVYQKGVDFIQKRLKNFIK